MRNVYKKITAIVLVAAMGATLGACGKKDNSDKKTADESVTVDTLNSEEASAALKQNLTVTLDDQDSAEGTNADGQDATESDGSDSGNNSNSGNGSAGTIEYVDVTDENGEVQTDADGNVETETVIKNGNSNSNGSGNDNNGGNNSNDGNSNGGDNSNSGDNANGGNSENSVADPNYVGKTTIAKTYWLDMTKSEDYLFDGEFLVATFKVKDATPDGNYPINITKADVANWDAETLTPDIVNGYVTVGDAEKPTTDSVTDGNFTFSVESVTAKAGDTIEVKFDVSSNPGLVAFVFNFSFDSNALEYQGLEVGKDAEDIITLSE